MPLLLSRRAESSLQLFVQEPLATKAACADNQTSIHRIKINGHTPAISMLLSTLLFIQGSNPQHSALSGRSLTSRALHHMQGSGRQAAMSYTSCTDPVSSSRQGGCWQAPSPPSFLAKEQGGAGVGPGAGHRLSRAVFLAGGPAPAESRPGWLSREALLSASAPSLSGECTSAHRRRWQSAAATRNSEHMPNMADSENADTCAQAHARALHHAWTKRAVSADSLPGAQVPRDAPRPHPRSWQLALLTPFAPAWNAALLLMCVWTTQGSLRHTMA